MSLKPKMKHIQRHLSKFIGVILVAPFFSFLPTVLGPGFLPSAQATQLIWSNPSQPPSGTWHALAMSDDGTRLVGAVYGGGIWTSSDSGTTWLSRSGAGNRNWTAVAVSQSSDVIYGVVDSGGVHRSIDFGVSWSQTSAPNCNYVGVATSGAANVSVACGGGSGKIYVNTNAGVGDASTWVVSAGTNNLNITDIKSSSDGSKLIASVWPGGVYMADDGTFNYLNKVSSPLTTYLWSAVGINSDGTKLIATTRGAPIYGSGGNVYTSADSGTTWVASSGANGANQGGSHSDWMAAAISADGSTMMAVAFGGPSRMSISRDSGATWVLQQTNTSNFIEAAICASGGRLASAAYGGRIFQTETNAATLSGLAVSYGTLSSTFNSCKTNYTANVANSVSTGFTVNPTKSQSNATTVQYFGATGTTPFTGNLSVGANVIRTVVTSQDGTSSSTYTVTVTRDSGVTTDASLSGLTISSGTLSPAFAVAATSYTVSVPNSLSSGFTVTATKSQNTATTVQYLGATGTTAFTGDLSVGTNIIRTVVTAQDGTTQQTYTVTVTRAASSDASLSDLAISSGTLSPSFATGTTSYTASVTNSVSSGFTVTPTKSQSTATINQYLEESGTTAFTGNLNVGANIIRIVVTAPDGATTNTYMVTVTRAPSADATLSALALSDVTLSPTFASATTSYTASVVNSVSSITVTPTRTQANATITVNGASVTSGSASGAISLNVGANTITVVITAQDGTTTSTYTVTVTRLSNDASLSNLTLSSGTLSPAFASGTTSYTASVANSGSTGYTITATKSQSTATINQYLGSSGSTAFTGNLSVGANIIRIVVTAPDGVATSTYTVTVTRAAQVSTITWNDQGATLASSGGSTTYSNGSAVASIPTIAPQKTGHTFVGWFTSASSGVQITNSSFTPASPYGNLTFYAHWTQNRSSAIANWAWSNQTSAGERKWHALATSADGSKLFAGVDDGGSLYCSTDFGVTWSVIANTAGRNWFFIASNIDGTKVAAVDRGGDIWTSTDSGLTWTARRVGGVVRDWEAIASSSDGVKLVAVASNGNNNGFIFTSSDSGVTWSSDLAPSGNNKFTGVSSSNDGTYLAVTTWAGGIYTSSDSGQTWSLRTLPVPNPGSSTNLQAVASSGDGSRLVTGSRLLGSSNGGIIFTSADYGVSWKAFTQTNLDYINFASNGDGSRLAASIYGQTGVSTSADFGATWSFQSVGTSGQISIASNIDGSLLFVGGYGGNLWTGKVPNSRVVAVLPSSTSASIAAAGNTPATALSFTASNAAVAVTVIPISNPTTEASTPFVIAQASVFDLSVVNVSGQVTICVDGGANVRLWHYTNGAWVDVTTSQTATQTCGVTSSFSPFATAPMLVTTPPAPIVVYVAPAPVPYLKTITTPQIRLTGDKLMCTAGTYNAGYTLGGVSQGSAISLFTPASYTFNLLFNEVVQSLLTVTTTKNLASWDLTAAPAGALVSCTVTVAANFLINTDASTENADSASEALAAKAKSLSAAQNEYEAAVSANSKSYQKALVDNRATWRANVEKVRAFYQAELNRINGLPASKLSITLKSAALKTYLADRKKTVADYKASGPAALAARDLTNKAALDTKNAAISKATSAYGSFIESIGYGVLIP